MPQQNDRRRRDPGMQTRQRADSARPTSPRRHLDPRQARRKKIRRKQRITSLLSMAVLAVVLLFLLLLVINRFSVTVQIHGRKEITLECGDHYTAPDAEAQFSGTIFRRHGRRAKVTVDNPVDTSKPGTYQVSYTGKYLWFSQKANQTVHIVDTKPPELTLKGSSSIMVTAGSEFVDPGYLANDRCDGDLTEKVTVTGRVNPYQEGTYYLQYSVSDRAGHAASATRTVTVVAPAKAIYLTFDDGPSENTEELLDVLKKYNVKATFFLVDSGYYDSMRRMAEEGHSLAIHTASHNYDWIYSSSEAFFEDLTTMRNVIRDETGVDTTLMRFPGGSSNTISDFNPGIMSYLTEAVKEKSYQYFDWNVDSGDASDASTAEEVYQNVIKGIGKKDTAIVLQHDTHKFSVDAVEKIILWGFDHGYVFLPLSTTSPTCHHVVFN